MLKAPTGDTECVAGLALFDLDNTLLDREAAFAVWAKGFIEANRLPPDAWSIIKSTDEDGFKPRDLFFSEIQEALGVTTSLDELLDRYYVDYPASTHCSGAARTGTAVSAGRSGSRARSAGAHGQSPPVTATDDRAAGGARRRRRRRPSRS
jgi:hypothetical protein